jgi:adenine/guanine phosphoribosyltransferase-like PRPP-binding protein
VEDVGGHASSAGEEMGSELEAIQERLRVLKRRLDARQSVVAVDDSIASGDAVSMNPLTAPDPTD